MYNKGDYLQLSILEQLNQHINELEHSLQSQKKLVHETILKLEKNVNKNILDEKVVRKHTRIFSVNGIRIDFET